MAKPSKLVTLVILVVLNFLAATGNGSSLNFTAPVLGKMPGAAVPKLTLGFEIALRGELEIEKEPQPHDINDLAKMIAELLVNTAQAKQEISDEIHSNATVIENDVSVVGHDNEETNSNAKAIKDEAPVAGDDNEEPSSNANAIKDGAPIVGDDKYIEQGKPEVIYKPDSNAKAVEDEASIMVDDEKCVEQGKFCTSIGPFCCKPLLCVNFVLVGVGICEDLHLNE